MKIKVTQDHIDNGEVGDSLLCPIALAMTESRLNKSSNCQKHNLLHLTIRLKSMEPMVLLARKRDCLCIHQKFR